MPTIPPDYITTVVSAAATGALVSGFFSFFSGWITKRSEERKHMREIAVRVATEHWKLFHETTKTQPTIDTLTVFLVNCTTLISAAEKGAKSDRKLRKQLTCGLSRVDMASDILAEHRRKQAQPKA